MPILLYAEFLGLSIEVYVILLILGVPIFLLWRWIFSRSKWGGQNKRIAIWGLTLISTPIIYGSLIMLWLFSIAYYPKNDFDSKKWQADAEKRYEMSTDIIDSKILIGKTKAEVRALLGPDISGSNDDNWAYYIGIVPGFANLDPDMLKVTFYKGRVVKVVQYGG